MGTMLIRNQQATHPNPVLTMYINKRGGKGKRVNLSDSVKKKLKIKNI